MLIRSLLSLVVVITVATPAFGKNWPAWRGPAGTGVTTETQLPLKWSSTENVTWKSALPGAGRDEGWRVDPLPRSCAY